MRVLEQDYSSFCLAQIQISGPLFRDEIDWRIEKRGLASRYLIPRNQLRFCGPEGPRRDLGRMDAV